MYTVYWWVLKVAQARWSKRLVDLDCDIHTVWCSFFLFIKGPVWDILNSKSESSSETRVRTRGCEKPGRAASTKAAIHPSAYTFQISRQVSRVTNPTTIQTRHRTCQYLTFHVLATVGHKQFRGLQNMPHRMTMRRRVSVPPSLPKYPNHPKSNLKWYTWSPSENS